MFLVAARLDILVVPVWRSIAVFCSRGYSYVTIGVWLYTTFFVRVFLTDGRLLNHCIVGIPTIAPLEYQSLYRWYLVWTIAVQYVWLKCVGHDGHELKGAIFSQSSVSGWGINAPEVRGASENKETKWCAPIVPCLSRTGYSVALLRPALAFLNHLQPRSYSITCRAPKTGSGVLVWCIRDTAAVYTQAALGAGVFGVISPYQGP